jgi:hypothetical protein
VGEYETGPTPDRGQREAGKGQAGRMYRLLGPVLRARFFDPRVNGRGQ